MTRRTGARAATGWAGWILGVSVALTLALLGTHLNPYLGDFGDDAEFLVLGQGLATGHGYAWVNSPERPPHNRYPPGYPALLAGTMLATGTAATPYAAIIPAKVVTAATLLMCALVLWPLARRRLRAEWAAGAVALFLLNPVAIRFATQVMSDVPYVPVFLAALAWAERSANGPDRRVRDWLALGALLALGAYLRSIGLVAAAGVLAWAWLCRPRKDALAVTSAFVVCMLPWWVRDASLAGGWRYLEELSAAQYQDPTAGTAGAGDLLARAADNASFIVGKPAAFGPLGLLLATAGATLLLLGALRSARVAGGAAEWAVAAVCISVLFWPIKTGRYLLPIIPLLGVYGLCGVEWLREWLERKGPAGAGTLVKGGQDGKGRAFALLPVSPVRLARVAPAAGAMGLFGACALFAVLSGRQAIENARAMERGTGAAAYYAERPEWARFLEAGDWLRANAGDGDVAMTRRHFALYVYSGHFADKYRFDTSEEELAYLTAGTARKYVVEDAFDFLRGDFPRLPAALRARGGDLRLRYETAEPAVRVWELVRP